MSKTKPTDAKKPADKDPKDKPADGGWRETIESIAMAVILALLFRGFVAEAFVIPTGSMAPTLQGRHKDVECPKCHYWYQTSASAERTPNDELNGEHVISTTCPMCRYTQQLDLFRQPNDHSYSGDRIIVGKFCYDLAQPKRWDVIVFKFPGNAVQNYIKRLIGLPNEQVWIMGGNIYTCGLNENPLDALRIARKPPHKLDALLQLVDDSDYIPAELTAVGWPLRWREWTRDGSKTPAWTSENDGKAFVTTGEHDHDAWLRYRHLVPNHADWQLIELSKQLPSSVNERHGQLISDFYAYNAGAEVKQLASTPDAKYLTPENSPAEYDPLNHQGPGAPPSSAKLGQHWVDDLAVEVLADVMGNSGELLLDVVRAGMHHECRINLADGTAKLTRIGADGQPLEFLGDDGQTAANATAQTSVKGPGSYRLRLSNCDHEVLLWVNGSVVQFDGPTTYDSDDLVSPAWSPADPGDLAPAGVGSRGAAVKLSQLHILHNKYYIAGETGHEDESDYDQGVRIADDTQYGQSDAERIQRIFADPELWSRSNLFADGNRRHTENKLQADQFLPMGDNSPQSYDGRFWGDNYTGQTHHYVERDLLIGKALLIYWPHTWNRPVPFTPNFTKMGRIR